MAAGAPGGGVVVLGVPRSGTTLLRRMLDAHSSFACPPETYVLSAAARFLHEERFAQGLRIGVLGGLSFAGFAEDDVLAQLRAFAFGWFEQHAQRAGKPRWAEKTAFDSFHLPAIIRLCQGHVRFVCVQRHGLDVACSLRELVDKTGGYVEELHRYVARTPEPLQAFAQAWVDVAGQLADLVERDPLAHAVRYEDLVARPEATVRDVLEFVGEKWEPGLVERALAAKSVGLGDWKTFGRAAVDGASVGRYKQLPQATLAALARTCNPMLARLGYERVPSEIAPDDDAKRRYELGLMLGRLTSKES